MNKNSKCFLCETDYPKHYQVAMIDRKTNQPVYLRMSEKQKNNYFKLIEELDQLSSEEIKKAEIILTPEGYEIKWKE